MSQTTPSLDTWFTLTTEVFQTYRLNKVSNPSVIAIAPSVVAPTVGTTAIVPTDNNAESLFLKGTKHSISDYKVFKEAKHWNTWGHHLLATAAAHGITDVLKPTYELTTASEKAVFKHAQAFAFSILTTCVQEPELKHLYASTALLIMITMVMPNDCTLNS